MSQSIREVMTRDVVSMPATATAAEAARKMRDGDIGNVVVVDERQVCGIVTDRDIVIRGVAEGHDPSTTKLADICSRDLTIVTPDADVSEAINLMRAKSLRRLPVVEGDQPIGIISLGDLAVERDPSSVLGEISAAPPNR
jgi:CBS domain-containing protein